MSPDPGKSVLDLKRNGHVLLLGLNRPDAKNQLNVALLRALSAGYTELEADPELRCAVVHAHGDDFTIGLDLVDAAPYMAEGRAPFDPGNVDPWGVNEPRRTKPVVIAVHGRCFTAGIELMLASDVVVAARGTRFAQLEISRGIFPLGGATYRMPMVAGWGNAMRYLLTADEFDADEAYRIGLVQQVVEPGLQLETAVKIARRIAEQAPLGVYATLANARLAQIEGPDAAGAAIPAEVARLAQTEDAMEGIASFLERRKAMFKGR